MLIMLQQVILTAKHTLLKLKTMNGEWDRLSSITKSDGKEGFVRDGEDLLALGIHPAG